MANPNWRKFTDEEKDWVLEYYRNHTLKECQSEFYKRFKKTISMDTIYENRRENKYTGYSFWKKWQHDYLMKNYKEKDISYLCKLLDKTVPAIRMYYKRHKEE